METRVVQLFARGVRRKREDLRADLGTRGSLEVSDRPGNSLGVRPMKVAELWEPGRLDGRAGRAALHPLLDVTLARVTRHGILLRGLQYGENGAAMFAQEWWCEIPAKD